MNDLEWGIQGVVFQTDKEFIVRRNYKKGLLFSAICSLFMAIIIVFMLFFSSLLSVIPEIIDDFNMSKEITDFSDNEEFGYRLDTDPLDYTDLAANKYPYSNLNIYPDFSSVVFIEGELNSERGWFSGGSGVIIDAYWILTAAHVVEDLIISETYVFAGNDFENYDEIYSIENFYLHPGWDKSTNRDEIYPEEHGIDIALIRLSDPINGINPASWANYENIDDEIIGDLIYVSGFGDYDSEFANCGESCLDDGNNYFSQKRAWSNNVDRMNDGLSPSKNYQNKEEFKGGLIAYDFDSPSRNHNSFSEGADEWSDKFGDFSFVGSGTSSSNPQPLEGVSVPGDSGGPSFAKINNEWLVIGLTSFGLGDTGDYGSVSFDTRVSVHSDWICSISDSAIVRIDGC